MIKSPPDASERELLRALQKDSQQSLRELAKAIGLPISTVHEKVKRLEREGYIKGYRAILDEKKLGFPITGFIFVSIMPSSTKGASKKKIAKQIAGLKNFQEVHSLAGDWDFIVKAKAASIQELGSLVSEKISAIPGVGKASASIVFETVKEEAALDL